MFTISFMSSDWFTFSVLREYLNSSKILSKTESESLSPIIIILFSDPKLQLTIFSPSPDPYWLKIYRRFMVLIIKNLPNKIIEPFFTISLCSFLCSRESFKYPNYICNDLIRRPSSILLLENSTYATREL